MLLGTIGFGIVLQSVAILIWGSFGIAVPTPIPNTPIDLGGVIVTSYQLLVLGVSAFAVLLLYFFLDRNEAQLCGMQAAAMDRSAATAMGVNVSSSNAIAFAIGSAIAALAGALVGPLLYVNPALGVYVGIKGFCGDVGGFGKRIPGAMRRRPHLRPDRGVRLGAALRLLGDAHVHRVRRGDDDPADRDLRRANGRPGMTRIGIGKPLLLVALMALPAVLDSYTTHVAILIMLFAIVAIGLSLVMGYAGQVNLAQAAFFGAGAYVSALLTTTYGWNPWLAAPFAILATCGIALAVAIPALLVPVALPRDREPRLGGGVLQPLVEQRPDRGRVGHKQGPTAGATGHRSQRRARASTTTSSR